MLLSIRRAGALGLLVAGLLLAAPHLAAASPVIYLFNGGSVTVSATSGATTHLVATSVPMTGTSVTFDDAVPSLTNIQLGIAAAGPFALAVPYAGIGVVSVTGVALSPAPGYTGAATLNVNGPPVDNYSYNTGPVKVTGLINGNPFNVVTPNATGTILVNAVSGNISLLGITIGVIPAFGGEPFPLVVKGDFFFHGAVPEPTTAALLGAGLVGLLAAGRRFRS